MRAKISGMVQMVDLAMRDGKPAVSNNGQPVHVVYLLQNGAGTVPEITKLKYYGSTPPKVGEKYEAVCNITAWKTDKGAVGLTAAVYS